jgi:hypothetical protein
MLSMVFFQVDSLNVSRRFLSLSFQARWHAVMIGSLHSFMEGIHCGQLIHGPL